MLIETERLVLRQFTLDDTGFVIALLNQPSFIKNIADKGVRTHEDACGYLRDGPLASYARFGFGLYCAVLKSSGVSIGMCGLLKRDVLEYADLGYAFLPDYWSQGFALEAALACVEHARKKLQSKHLDMVIANQVGEGQGFEQDCNEVTVVTKQAEFSLPKMHKVRLAGELVRMLAETIRHPEHREGPP